MPQFVLTFYITLTKYFSVLKLSFTDDRSEVPNSSQQSSDRAKNSSSLFVSSPFISLLFSLWKQLMYTASACQRRGKRLTCRRTTEMNTDEI